jgi:Biotin-lipoyl like
MHPTEQQMNHNRWAPSGNGHSEVAYPLDSRVVADLAGTRTIDEGEVQSQQPRKPRPSWRRRLVTGLVVAAILWVGLYYGVPFVREVLVTVQTDDAFVAGHITYVSPRIEDVVTEVLVDQNDRIEPGDLLVKLDREPFEVAVAQAEASLEEARANVVQSRAQVASQIARARASDRARYATESSGEPLDQLLRPDPDDPQRGHSGRGRATRSGLALADGPQPGAGDGLPQPLLGVRDHGPGGATAGLADEKGAGQGRARDALIHKAAWLGRSDGRALNADGPGLSAARIRPSSRLPTGYIPGPTGSGPHKQRRHIMQQKPREAGVARASGFHRPTPGHPAA